METTFTILQDGTIGNPKAVRKFFESHEPGTWVLSSKAKNVRSLPQNAFYWAVCVPMIKDGLRDMGYDEIKNDNQAHEILKARFLKKTVGNPETSMTLETIRSTTELTKLEFCEYIEEIQKFGSEFLGIMIPNPGESVEIDFKP